jgi:hypothetical protein
VTSLRRETLLNLLKVYDAAIAQLGSQSDPRIDAFRSRLRRRRTDVIAALAAQR